MMHKAEQTSAFCAARLARVVASVLLFYANFAMAQDSVPNTLTQRLAPCLTCHGKEGRAASDGFYPRIAGKPSGYVYNQLINFRSGRRTYPLMIYMVDHQTDAYLREIAGYFSGLHPPYPAPQAVRVSDAVLERGRRIVTSGDAVRNVPACVACHGKALTGLEPAIPGLLGLPQDYLNAQLGAWKSGSRHASVPDCMAQIVERLDPADIGAAAAWLAAQSVPEPALAARAVSDPLPLQCGSVPN